MTLSEINSRHLTDTPTRQVPVECRIYLVSDNNTNGTKHLSETTYQLTLIAVPNWPTTPVQRLRAALKLLLRGYGLRAVAVKPVCKQDKPC